MEAVAARAGVGKPTLYRWWPDRRAVAMAALLETDPLGPAASRDGSALAELRQQLRLLAVRLGTPTGRHVLSMIAASDPASDLSKAFRERFALGRRAEGKVLLERAVREGEVRADLDIEVALDMLHGALFFRLLLGHAPLEEHFANRALAVALRGMVRPRRSAGPVRPKPTRAPAAAGRGIRSHRDET